MIAYINQNIAEIDTGVIAQGCNIKPGVMGAGLALVLKNKFPQIFPEYKTFIRRADETNVDILGKAQFSEISENLFVANCFTQRYPGPCAESNAIRDALKEVFEFATYTKLPVYLPKIGCGIGGLDYEKDVEPIIQELATLFPDVDTYVCIWP
jgi:O-acetyl-ADP-ribose deacetylase (regulator of RNase III)